MSPEPTLSLSRRAVACPGWRWMPGMRSVAGWIVYDNDVGTVDIVEVLTGDLDMYNPNDPALTLDSPDALQAPDLADPATLGCLLALVREAWGEPALHLVALFSPRGSAASWAVATSQTHYVESVGSQETEAEALVCALEARS